MNASPSRSSDGNLLGRGASIGRFQVIGLVGKGGMGEVYAAYDPELDRNVAIKLLRAGRNSESDEGRARMMREAQAIARVSHPNVVVVYDAGTFQDRVFIAMEFVEGHTLGYWMHARTRSWPEVLEVFTAAGRGLAAAHERDLVHRDFKPDNVMIGADGQVRVMDFGLVQIAGERDAGPGSGDDITGEVPLPGGAEAAAPSAVAPESDDLLTTRALSTTPARATRYPTPPRGLARSAGRASRQPQPQPHPLRRQPGHAGLHVARAVPQRADRRRHRSVQLLRRAVRGAVRRAAVLGPQLRRAGAQRRQRLRAHGAQGLARAGLDPRGPAARPGGEPGRALAVDERAARPAGAAARGRQPPALRRRRRRQAGRRAGKCRAATCPTEAPTRTEMRRAFLATGKPYAKKAWINSSRILDSYAQRWSELYVESCEATHVRNEHSTEVLDLRIGCLQEGLEDLKALCRAFRKATPEVVENAVSAANALGGLDRCEDIELLRAVVRPPEDAATRAAVARLRAELSEVRDAVPRRPPQRRAGRRRPAAAAGDRHRLRAPAGRRAAQRRHGLQREGDGRRRRAPVRGGAVDGAALPPRRGGGRGGHLPGLSGRLGAVARRGAPRSGAGSPRRCSSAWAGTS